MNRKAVIEEILDTSLTSIEYKALRENFPVFCDRPYKVVYGHVAVKNGKKYGLSEVLDWLDDFRRP